jgi:hypothetical protein
MPNSEDIQIGGGARRAEELAATAAQEMRDRFGDLDQKIRRVCRERPLTVLFGAIAAGFIVGRIVAKR